MRRSRGMPLYWFLAVAGIGWGAPPQEPQTPLVKLPLSFEANHGQTDPSVKFLSRGDGYALFLTSDSAVFKLRSSRLGSSPSAIRMKLAGANSSGNISGAQPLPGTVNYFIGNDPDKWTTGAGTYKTVNYRQIYQGIDLVYYGTQRQLEYDFVVAPWADPKQIALEFSGAKPQQGPDGDLVLTLDGGQLTFRKPVVYQMNAGKKELVAGSYKLSGDRVQFALGRYDHSRALVIDPVLNYLTYLGGSTGDNFIANRYQEYTFGSTQGIAVDSGGNVYVAGTTLSTDFPLKGPYSTKGPPNNRTYAGFVAKLNPAGSQLIYSTYFGGSAGNGGNTHALAIAVDPSGSAYVTGWTQAPDFPVTAGAYQTLCGYLDNFKVSSCPNTQSAFLTKFSPSGNSLVYSTFFGPVNEAALAVAVDSQGRAYIAGISGDACASSDLNQCFPTTANAVLPGSTFNNTANPGNFNQGSAFIAAFDATAANLLYSSMYGGKGSSATGNDGKPGNNGPTNGPVGVAVDAMGNFYLAGNTQSNQIPVTPGAFQATYYGPPRGTEYRGFVAKFSPVTGIGAGATLLYSTYLGGTGATYLEQGLFGGIAADASGNAYIAGNTTAYDFPVTIAAPTSCTATSICNNVGYLTKLNPTGSALVWSTLVGTNPATCCGGSVAGMSPPRLDLQSNVYVSGLLTTAINGFPLVNPLQPRVDASGVFVTKYDPTGSTILFSTEIYSPTNQRVVASGIDVDPQGNIYVAGNTSAGDLPVTAGAFQPAFAGGSGGASYDGFIAKINMSIPSPTVAVGGIVPNGGSGSTIQPGEWVSIFGSNLATGTATWTGNFPTSLGGTSVSIDGKPAYLWYVSPTQINLQVPNDANRGTVQVVVTTGTGGVAFATVTLGSFAPSFSLLDSKHVAAIIPRSNGSGAYGGGTYDIVGPTGSSLGYATVAAKAGDTVELFGVGFGPTNPPVPAGSAFNGAAPTTNPVTLNINGVSVTPSFAGETGAGLYQLNITIPPGLGAGDVSLQASVGGAQTPAVMISLQ